MRHKFGAVRCKVGERSFGSKLEARFYQQLQILQKSGQVLFFLMQIPFVLPGNIKYLLDFMVFYAPKDGQPGEIEFVECKGMMTDTARIKLAQVTEIYGIDIKIVKA